MKKRHIPDKTDLEVLRDMILSFACDKHDFALVKDEFSHAGAWNSVFEVKIKGTDGEDLLFCEAPLGEFYLRFGLDLTISKEVMEKEHGRILQEISKFDVAIKPDSDHSHGNTTKSRLTMRAWTPTFNQRIFGLTLSNLLDCKKAVTEIIKQTE